ncbi:MAG: iron-sulfur cluster-binding protein, partial [Bacillota bacterium]
LNFEEGGNPVQMNRIIAGKDPVLIDAYAAHLMGFDIEEVPYMFLQTCCPRNIMIFPGRPQKTHPLINRERTIASPLE